MFGSWRRQLGAWAWITPIGLVLSLFAGYYVATNSAATYMATRQVLFLSKPTSNPEVGYEVNPFLSFGSSLYTAASVVAISVTDERSTKEIINPGSLAEYTVTEQPGGSVPVLNIEANAPTPVEADLVADTVVERVALVLADEQKQAKAPKQTWIVSSLIGSSLDPARVWKKNIVLGIAAAAAVVLATVLFLLIVIWTKHMLARRRLRRSAAAAAQPDSPEIAQPVDSAPDPSSGLEEVAGQVPAESDGPESAEQSPTDSPAPRGERAPEADAVEGTPGASTAGEPTAEESSAEEPSSEDLPATPQAVGSGGPTGRAS